MPLKERKESDGTDGNKVKPVRERAPYFKQDRERAALSHDALTNFEFHQELNLCHLGS